MISETGIKSIRVNFQNAPSFRNRRLLSQDSEMEIEESDYFDSDPIEGFDYPDPSDLTTIETPRNETTSTEVIDPETTDDGLRPPNVVEVYDDGGNTWQIMATVFFFSTGFLLLYVFWRCFNRKNESIRVKDNHRIEIKNSVFIQTFSTK